MADTLQETKENKVYDSYTKQILLAESLADLLKEHKGENVCLLDLREINNWTDFFIIATAASKTRMEGMERHLKDFCRENQIEILGHSRKNKAAGGYQTSDYQASGNANNNEDGWRLIDLGWAVVHLMTKDAREFYDLERLWRK